MIAERRAGPTRLIAECADASAVMAASVLEVFARREPKAGTSIRFGWSLLRLAEDGDALRVMEPDFARWPDEHWIPTIDTTLTVVGAQTALLQRLGVEGEDAFFDQILIATSGALDAPEIFLRRVTPISAEDSGWLLGTQAAPEALTGDNLEPLVLAALTTRRPTLLQALTLPTGAIAVFSDDVLQQVFDAAGRTLL